jgi:anti-anti-sigma regulatory factor
MSALYDESVAGIHLVNLKGPLNLSRAEGVIQLFKSLSEQGVERIVVNLEDVPFIDSRGLVALIAGYKIFGGDAPWPAPSWDRDGTRAGASQGGQNFRLARVQSQPRLVFELTGFDHVFQIFGSVAEATATGPYVQALPGWSSPLLAPQSAALRWAA